MFHLKRESAIDLPLQQLIDCQGFALRDPLWRKLTSAEQAGNHISRQRGQGMEFDEVRQYQAGDDVRSIDWRVTARTGRPHTKIFREERDRPVIFAIDLSSSSFFGSGDKLKAMMAAELCAILGWQAHAGRHPIGLLILTDIDIHWVRPQQQRSNWLINLQKLCDIYNQQLKSRSATATPLTKSFEHLNQRCRSGYQIHWISDFYSLKPSDHAHLSRMARHNQVSAWQITDPFEYQLPRSSDPTSLQVIHAQGQGQLPVSDPDFKHRYEQAALSRQSTINNGLQSAIIAHHQLSTQSDWQHYV